MYIQLNMELATGEIKPAYANKECDLQEAREDVIQVLNVAKRQFSEKVVGWNARFVDFNNGAQLLVEGEPIGESWICKLSFIDCTQHDIDEALKVWAVSGFKPTGH